MAVEYDGTDFCGFQRQPAVRTVAGVLEDALEEVFEKRIAVTAAGRTDSGVHATGQVISCALPRAFPVERLANALNAILPDDLSARDAVEVPTEFSARRSAASRTYLYCILNERQRLALVARHAWHVHRPLDLDAMREAATHLLGERDFRSFCALPEQGGTRRNVLSFAVERDRALLCVEISADGFLHHMVRAIVGTLVECGHGQRAPDSIPATLAAGDRAAAGMNAPARGLYLVGVRYPDGYDSYRRPLLAARP